MSILKDLNFDVRRAMDADKELYQHSHAALVRNMQKATLVTACYHQDRDWETKFKS